MDATPRPPSEHPATMTEIAFLRSTIAPFGCCLYSQEPPTGRGTKSPALPLFPPYYRTLWQPFLLVEATAINVSTWQLLISYSRTSLGSF